MQDAVNGYILQTTIVKRGAQDVWTLNAKNEAHRMYLRRYET